MVTCSARTLGSYLNKREVSFSFVMKAEEGVFRSVPNFLFLNKKNKLIWQKKKKKKKKKTWIIETKMLSSHLKQLYVTKHHLTHIVCSKNQEQNELFHQKQSLLGEARAIF